jgi:hypothetical protein
LAGFPEKARLVRVYFSRKILEPTLLVDVFWRARRDCR